MLYRTDLALELPAVHPTVRTRRGFSVHQVDIRTPEEAQSLGKPQGTYITVSLEKLLRREDDSFALCAQALAEELSALLPLGPEEPVLVVGLGNPRVTPDAVGHEVLSHLLITRHLTEELHFLRPVAALEPGVLGTTGIESAGLIAAAASLLHPAAVLAVDALAALSTSRLLRTVQLSDAGIAPGSGIGNNRAPLSRDTLGVPVIGIGIPTVVDAATLTADTARRAGLRLDDDSLRREQDSLIVTPCDIDTRLTEISRALAYALNLALHPGLTVGDLDALL